jgi:hypothetical protein
MSCCSRQCRHICVMKSDTNFLFPPPVLWTSYSQMEIIPLLSFSYCSRELIQLPKLCHLPTTRVFRKGFTTSLLGKGKKKLLRRCLLRVWSKETGYYFKTAIYSNRGCQDWRLCVLNCPAEKIAIQTLDSSLPRCLSTTSQCLLCKTPSR